MKTFTKSEKLLKIPYKPILGEPEAATWDDRMFLVNFYY